MNQSKICSIQDNIKFQNPIKNYEIHIYPIRKPAFFKESVKKKIFWKVINIAQKIDYKLRNWSWCRDMFVYFCFLPIRNKGNNSFPHHNFLNSSKICEMVFLAYKQNSLIFTSINILRQHKTSWFFFFFNYSTEETSGVEW